ncbi:MAG: hypothetical protein ACK5LN_15005 [Propioniciclava sp.]
MECAELCAAAGGVRDLVTKMRGKNVLLSPGVALGLPGGEAVLAASVAGLHVTEFLQSWVATASLFAEGLDATACAFEATDAEVAEALGRWPR